MEAMISGSVGVALIMDGDQFASIHIDEPERTVPRDPAEYHYLIGEGRDFITVEGVTREEVVRQLNLAYDRDDALELVLILQDPELPEDIRRDAVPDLEELLQQGEVGVFLEGVLYGQPLPAALDIRGAMRFSREAKSRELLTLLELLWAHQDTIREVRAAWEAIPRELFSGEYDYWQATLVREGAFRELVHYRASGRKINDLFVEISSRSAVNALPNYRAILWQWMGSLIQNDVVPEAGLSYAAEVRGPEVRFDALKARETYRLSRAAFQELVAKWREATRYSSSLTDMVTHPAYQRIVGMGAEAVPLLLEELRREPDHWFWALKAITGEDPVDDEMRGDLQAMRQAWLDWGHQHGYC